jgi:ribosomal protein L2
MIQTEQVLLLLLNMLMAQSAMFHSKVNKVGDTFIVSEKADVNLAIDCLSINIPVGTFVYNVELKKWRCKNCSLSWKLCRSYCS